jgi:hypothetical protein
MGQEVVYCFKCQSRITTTDFAKGQAYQVENNFCCSSCAVGVLETLPPKAKEQLLAKMFKATHDRQSASSASVKTSANPPPPSSTSRIPHATPRPMKVGASASSGPLIAGILGAIVAVILGAVFLSSGSSSPPPAQPTVTTKPPVVANGDPGPSAEEKRRDESAKDALKKAREFAQANPKDLDGQVRQWRSALQEAARTGYEAEARRETEKAEGRLKDAVAQELSDLERESRALASKKDFKAATDLVDRSRTKRTTPEWSARVDALRRELDDAAARSLQETKEKAAAWRPIYDGKTLGFLTSECLKKWRVVDGAITRDPSMPDGAAQSREDYGDGEFRFRFTFHRISNCFFAVRQAAGGQVRVLLARNVTDGMSAGPHEVIFTCRGSDVSATLNGAPTPVEVLGTVLPRGRIQFNFSNGSYRLLSLEMRDLP